MKIILTRKEIREAYSGIRRLLNNEKVKRGFSYALIRNKDRLERLGNTPETQDSSPKLIDEHLAIGQKDVGRLMVEYCKKNEEGESILTEKGDYVGLNYGLNPKYDEEVEKINNENEEFLDKEVEFDAYMIKEEHVPKVCHGLALDSIAKFIEGGPLNEKKKEGDSKDTKETEEEDE